MRCVYDYIMAWDTKYNRMAIDCSYYGAIADPSYSDSCSCDNIIDTKKYIGIWE